MWPIPANACRRDILFTNLDVTFIVIFDRHRCPETASYPRGCPTHTNRLRKQSLIFIVGARKREPFGILPREYFKLTPRVIVRRRLDMRLARALSSHGPKYSNHLRLLLGAPQYQRRSPESISLPFKDRGTENLIAKCQKTLCRIASQAIQQRSSDRQRRTRQAITRLHRSRYHRRSMMYAPVQAAEQLLRQQPMTPSDLRNHGAGNQPSSTMRALSSSPNRRRRPVPVITSARRAASGLSV